MKTIRTNSDENEIIVLTEEVRNDELSESSDKITSTNENPLNESNSTNIRLHVTPSSNSSISFLRPDHDSSMVDEISDETETPDESHLVEQIQAVRNDPDGLNFRIKLLSQPAACWISSKVANHKYPQAVIAFWENHVEFT